ncbi:hypothetical protein P9239_03575 [Caballeronia sp. LZ062]|uniref:hypothetical protein n=1 Tax=unclassified Caballeronia TaxID=2646786 RepID=UPI00286690E1|nr:MULTISPECIES: hypothetical protein [unclassified Caballeronia]MDR5857168.1 hypothetical protein [Caballeronia sp. LZ050]MDR5869436.1 hypothetical protein [Caballeronia sp. LZ062]
MKPTLVISDLAPDNAASRNEAALSRRQMQDVVGGRSVLATVDGRSTAAIDDWQMNIAIFEGRVGGPYIV